MNKSGAYWKERFEQMEDAQHNVSMQQVSMMQEQFDKAQAAISGKINAWYQRFAKNNGVSMSEARKMLSNQELKELKWNVEDYIKYGKENKVSGAWLKQLENASARVHISRLEALKLEVQQEAEKLFGNYSDAVDSHIRNVYANDFYHTAYEIQKGIGVGSRLQSLDDKVVSKIVSKPWAVDGKNFSERIWDSKTKLINNVHNSLSRMCITGASPDRAIREIANAMKVSKSQAGRLVMTESAAFANKAREDCMNDLGVEEFEFVATLDSITSEICRGMDGKHYPMSEYVIGVTAPPLHPNCRSCTCPYFDDEFTVNEKRAARGEDGKTYYVPADTSYEEWKKSFVDGDVIVKDRFGLITNNNKSNPRYYDYEGKTIDIVEQEICKNDYETAVCFDKNGKAIFAQVQKGDDYEIRFTKYQMRRMKGNDVTHNHPLSTPPSPDDVNVLRKNKANSIRTTGRNGTYVLEYSDIEKLPDYDELSNVYDEILAELQPKYIEMIKNGMEEKNAIVKLGDEIWEKLYDIYGVKPKFIRR